MPRDLFDNPDDPLPASLDARGRLLREVTEDLAALSAQRHPLARRKKAVEEALAMQLQDMPEHRLDLGEGYAVVRRLDVKQIKGEAPVIETQTIVKVVLVKPKKKRGRPCGGRNIDRIAEDFKKEGKPLQ